MKEDKWTMTSKALLTSFLLFFGSLIIVFLSPSINASTTDLYQNAGALSSSSDQIVTAGDHILYDVTVNGDQGTLRFDYSDVTSTQVTVHVTSTIWYFSSLSYTTDIYYNENGEIKLPGVTDEFVESNMIGETTIQTVYGLKDVTIFSFWYQGSYSDILRTYYVPVGCQVYYKYYGNDTDGNHIMITLTGTSMEWLRNVGQVPVPGVPSNLSAIESNAKVVLSWTAPDDNGYSISNYNIYRSSSEIGPYSKIASPIYESYADNGLTNGKTYWYKISAVNTGGEGDKTYPISAIPYSVPNAPNGLIATSGDAQVTLYWNAPFSGGRPIDYYIVYQDSVVLLDHPTGLMMIITDLNNGQEYNFTVAAHNLAGIGPYSEPESATPISEPDPPVGLIATPSNAQVTLIWGAPPDFGGSPITNYKIYRGSTSEGEKLLTTLTNVLTYTDSGLTNGEEYWYKVSAVNAIGEGALSNAVYATPITIPDSPVLVSAIGGVNSVSLIWEESIFNGGSIITGYKVFYGLSEPTTQYGEVLPATTLTVSVTGLVPGASYEFCVIAVNAAGDSSPSNIADATVPNAPGMPYGVEGAPIYYQVTLIWLPPTDTGGSPITQFSIYRGTSVDNSILLGNSTTTTFIDRTVTPGSTYLYSVGAINAVGESPRSTFIVVTIPLPTLCGRVVDSDGDGMAGITVALENGSSVETDAEGNFTIAASPGNHTLTISGQGIESQTVSVTIGNLNSDLGTITAQNESGGGNNLWLYVGVGVVAILAVAGIAFLMMRRKK
jgi:fibronectin type 3 domain-containing protein